MGPASIPLLIILIASSLAVVSSFAAPFLAEQGIATGLDGRIGAIDHGGLWSSMDPVSHIAYLVGDFMCHQESTRSFVLNGNQMPFCIRDVSLLAGLAIGCAMAAWKRKELGRMSGHQAAFCFALILLTPAEWIAEAVTGEDLVIPRIIVSVVTALAASALLAWVLEREYGTARGSEPSESK